MLDNQKFYTNCFLKVGPVHFWKFSISAASDEYKNKDISATISSCVSFLICLKREILAGSYDIRHIGRSAGQIGEIGYFLQ